MAIEQRRKCGYRKVGGLYLVSNGEGAPCCKMPILLKVCPTCNGGVKQTRGWSWIDPRPWLKGECTGWDGKRTIYTDKRLWCPCAHPDELGPRVGLLWIGVQFYPSPEDFAKEAKEMGICRRITAVPRGFVVGEHWVFLAHPHVRVEGEDWVGGVFRVFKPDRIEKIVTETMAKDDAEMAKLKLQRITPVIVPDDDKDHQGTVYEDEEPELELT